jgi:hypothetical protein
MTNRWWRSGCGVAVVAVAMGVGARARAQEPNSVAAQALFDDGRKLMTAQKYEEACIKLEESQRLDPGVGTQYAMADCYALAGRVASAWVSFLDVVAKSNAQGRADRARVAQQRAEALLPRLSKIDVVVPPASRVAGLEVKRDGEAVRQGQWGTAVPVDPGSHVITARAPGKQEFRTTVDVRVEGKTFQVTIPALQDGAPEATPVSPQKGTERAAPPPGIDARAPSGGLGTQRTLAIVMAGLGVAAAFAGTFFGLQSFSKHSDAESHCAGNACDPTGLQLTSDGKSAGNVSTIAFGAGGVAIAAAVVFWITAPSRASTRTTASMQATPLVAPGVGGLQIGGRF